MQDSLNTLAEITLKSIDKLGLDINDFYRELKRLSGVSFENSSTSFDNITELTIPIDVLCSVDPNIIRVDNFWEIMCRLYYYTDSSCPTCVHITVDDLQRVPADCYYGADLIHYIVKNFTVNNYIPYI